ncbi:SipW-dependent-type signal peptide-containing protein [Microbacterium sp. SSW1-49]|uniref:SipW-dependent-type signal peptide-containing protein n=1 Tax=Microbacterium croceum TaxID=2851645 RepID=A0ABT0FHY4_9MICO|nr:SipW-dependent-type signal peptide-containing protein [Microbacterium croceum]MCK2037657.1 SipW-dependent-type signal peptide-containing protein [Microbacterium croceum]
MNTRRSVREAKRIRSRRIRAVLAGGLVLGIGAGATLAAWNDSEYGSATFTAGRFDIVGAADGSTFASHATAGAPASLTFAATPSSMVPGATTYALFSVKTASPSVAGNLQWNAVTPSATGLAVYLRYGVRTIPAATACTSTSYAAGTSVVPDLSVLATNGTATQAISANGGSTVNYCIAVTLQAAADNTVQGASTTLTWQVLGTAAAP